jgi:hypothetical protein
MLVTAAVAGRAVWTHSGPQPAAPFRFRHFNMSVLISPHAHRMSVFRFALAGETDSQLTSSQHQQPTAKRVRTEIAGGQANLQPLAPRTSVPQLPLRRQRQPSGTGPTPYLVALVSYALCAWHGIIQRAPLATGHTGAGGEVATCAVSPHRLCYQLFRPKKHECQFRNRLEITTNTALVRTLEITTNTAFSNSRSQRRPKELAAGVSFGTMCKQCGAHAVPNNKMLEAASASCV